MKNILIMEDDGALQQIYKEALSKMAVVHIAATGKEGLEKANTNAPDLIILDIMLPGGMNGFDVLENLRRNPQFQFTPVLILTNIDSEKQMAMKVGAADYLVKSNTSIDEVIRKVKTLLKIN